MPAKKSAKKETQKSTSSGASKGFTDDERAAMRERAQELKAELRGRAGKEDEESAVLAKIAAMQPADRDGPAG